MNPTNFVSVLERGLLDPFGALIERDGLSQVRGDSFETVNESRQGGVCHSHRAW